MHVLRFSIAAIVAVGLCARESTAEHAAVAPYLTDEVVTVGVVDLTKIDLPAAVEEFARFGIASDAELVEARQAVSALQQALAELPKAGARRLYLLHGTGDFIARGPTWVVEVAEGGDAKRVVDLLTSGIQFVLGNRQFGDFKALMPKEFKTVGNVVLGGPSAERLATIEAARSQHAREDAVQALDALTGADAGVVSFGNADTRRVIREMFPQAPAPFAEFDGKFLDEALKWISVTVKMPPQPTITVTFNTVDAAKAGVVQQAMIKGLELAKALELMELASDVPFHRARATALLPVLAMQKPHVEGTRVSLTLGDDKEEMAALGVMLKMVDESAGGAQQMNQFKQIALGMLNYESSKKSYPPAASRDAAGRPLLSWRVLILPYIDQNDLYEKFHLDEPWDSEHNKQLIAEMPDVYQEPNGVVRRAIGGEGLTTYQVPTGEATVFFGPEGTKLRTITDGTSNTILAVAVAPEHAVPWTKPDDWQVDLKDPLRDLKGGDRKQIVAAYCDGSVRTLPIDIAPEKLAAVLTRAGGEPVSP